MTGKKTFLVNALVLAGAFAESKGWIHTGLSADDAVMLLGAVNLVLRLFTKGPHTVPLLPGGAS